MKRWAAFVSAVCLLLVGGLAVGSRVVLAEDEDGEHDKTRIEKHIRILRPDGAFLGVGLEDLEGDRRGAKVRSVEPESAAEEAGIQDGDVIERFDGVDVRSARQLSRLVRETPVGREVEIQVDREGTTKTLTATLEERRRGLHVGEGGVFVPDFEAEDFDLEVLPGMPHPPHSPPLPRGPMPHVYRWHGDDDDFTMSWLPARPRLGVSIMDIEGQLADYFGLEADGGVLVSSVKDGSPADEAGLRSGDVILEFDGEAIRSGRELRRHVRRAGGGTFTVRLLRDRKPVDVQVTLPEPEEPKPMRPATGVSL